MRGPLAQLLAPPAHRTTLPQGNSDGHARHTRNAALHGVLAPFHIALVHNDGVHGEKSPKQHVGALECITTRQQCPLQSLTLCSWLLTRARGDVAAHRGGEGLCGLVELPDGDGAVLAAAEQELPRRRQRQHLPLRAPSTRVIDW